MRRALSRQIPALLAAAAILVATLLVREAPRSLAAAVAAALLVAATIVGIDVARRRRAGGPARPSMDVALIAAAILVACGLLVLRDSGRLAEMLPILGSSAALPLGRRDPGCPWRA